MRNKIHKSATAEFRFWLTAIAALLLLSNLVFWRTGDGFVVAIWGIITSIGAILMLLRAWFPVSVESQESGAGENTQLIQRISDHMIAVQGGTFTMGCVTGRDVDCAPDEKPHHTVILSNFRIGKFPVTQEEWLAVMGDNPAGFTGLDRPVEKVSWEEVQEFLLRLNALTGKNYRLPTEAEWEFAARGGILSQGFMFSGSNDLDMVAWYSDNSGHETKPVGQKHPNELGLYDMSGNVWEWCSDWYGTYNNIEETNPQGPVEGSRRVLRGGSWLNLARHCRISNREHRQPVYRPDNQGFRLAMTDD